MGIVPRVRAIICILSGVLCAAMPAACQVHFEKAQPSCGTTSAKSPPVSDATAPVFVVGGEVKPPKLICSVAPIYPRLAREKKLQGVAIVSLVVGAEGIPTDVKVVNSLGDGVPLDMHTAGVALDQSAIEAVKAYRFEPSTYRGKPVAVRITAEVNFHIY